MIHWCNYIKKYTSYKKLKKLVDDIKTCLSWLETSQPDGPPSD